VEAYRIDGLTFTYPTRKLPALAGIDLVVGRGDFVVLCGPSGCGKTTLLRHLKPSATPHGARDGLVFFEGTPLESLPAREAAAKIGFVSQSPENQIVTDKVWHELAFGLESLGLPTEEIRLRSAETASFFGIQQWFRHATSDLSGGQKQILALASVMAMQPAVLLLDEPTSQLDPIAAGDFLAIVAKINRELGTTVILTEHRLEEALPLATRVAAMDGGRIVGLGTPREVGLALRGRQPGIFLTMPTPMRVWAAFNETDGDDCPITVREGAAWLADKPLKTTKPEETVKETVPQSALTLRDVWFRYGKALPDVLKGVDFAARYGEIAALLGGNGTGKTTAISVAAGIYKPLRGKVTADAKVYMLSQSPQFLFTAKTVWDDLRDAGGGPEETERITKLCRLEGLLGSHPYDLSGGEQQRAALAKVLLKNPKILLLDEPTKGLDAEYKRILAGILRELAESGAAVVIVSHDVEFCAEYSDRCSLFFDGGVLAENTAREFFSGNRFYTTGANRMARSRLPWAITADDIVRAMGGDKSENVIVDGRQTDNQIDDKNDNPPKRKDIDKSFLINPFKNQISLFGIILITMSLTIYFGVSVLNDRRFHFISMLILIQAMLPFALTFERRKPAARELVIIAVLCAIGVAGRGAFFMLPQFKPVVAVVIIAGVALGGHAGFLVGALTAFVSNMFFGQGPWTPWQMFALGLIGLLAGLLFHKKRNDVNRMVLALFGGFAAFVVYGGIMNPAGVILFQPNPTLGMLLFSFVYGLPFDLVHAAATVAFILLISKPLLEKLGRIRVKYGIY
jgi:energy-coupling factor transporter ATP-binding protein EcfA2/uncharacterized membrane protein